MCCKSRTLRNMMGKNLTVYQSTRKRISINISWIYLIDKERKQIIVSCKVFFFVMEAINLPLRFHLQLNSQNL